MHDPAAKGTDLHEKILSAMKDLKSSQSTSKEPCRNFRKGRCQRRNCRFSHDTKAETGRTVDAACWDFRRGECKRLNCRFTHEKGARGKPSDAPRGRNNKCPYFNRVEGCRYGADCNKAHSCSTCDGKDHNAVTHSEWLAPGTSSM